MRGAGLIKNNVSSTATRLVGDTVSNARIKDDFYPTPQWATAALLERERFVGKIWEPACGAGDISKVLNRYGYVTKSSDLVYRGFGTGGIDFLASRVRVDNIITNPPFSLSLEFIRRSKLTAKHKIAMFMKSTALEGVNRHVMWIDKEFPFCRMYQFVRRVSFGQAEGTHKSGGMMSFAWFVWDKEYEGKPTIEWID